MHFSEAVDNQISRTENGMKAFEHTSNACTDLFFQIGASRGKDIIPLFIKAFIENEDAAIRIALWSRDVRAGAGERQLFKDILSYMEKHEEILAKKMIFKIPELGRWDDMLIDYSNEYVEAFAFGLYRSAIFTGDALAAKWAPRKGPMALKLRKAWKMSPKQYRKTIVNLSKVVETQMCNKEWNEIDFSSVPSLAHSRYRKAFFKNCNTYEDYIKSLIKGDDPKVKINAGAVYPYDVVKNLLYKNMSKTEQDSVIAQWDALPNYIGDSSILPMVDVSGSMNYPIGGSKSLTCMDVAVSLGLYCADKNTGLFKNTFLTFSTEPELLKMDGNIFQKYQQIKQSKWGMSTDLHAAFNKVLDVATENNVSNKDMPETVIILSDMQFNNCVEFDDSAFQMIKRKYEKAGYQMPVIIFWNLNSSDNAPVKFDESGVALISGFSPAIMKSVLAGDDSLNPLEIMLNVIKDNRYNY